MSEHPDQLYRAARDERFGPPVDERRPVRDRDRDAAEPTRDGGAAPTPIDREEGQAA